jgi:two-component system cell cycle sensor histidine kinase/response regulator CckA
LTWLAPALIATLACTGILFILYVFIFMQYQRRFLALWAGGWGIYGLTLVFILLQIYYGRQPITLIMQHLMALLSGWLLLCGVNSFLSRKTHSIWLVLFAVVGLWTPLEQSLGVPKDIAGIPSFFLIAAMQIYAGLIILKQNQVAGFAKHLTGWCLLIWGLHRADYPFLKDVAWFAPWGFMLAAALTTLVSMSFLLLYFERLKNELQQTHDTLKTILDIVPVGIGMVEKRTLVWNNGNFEHMLGYEKGELHQKPTINLYITHEEYKRVGETIFDQMRRLGQGGMEVKLLSKGGEQVPVHLLGRPINPEDISQGHIVTLVDISDREFAENALRELAAGVAHNFNNVLMAIASNTEAAMGLLSDKKLLETGELLHNVVMAAMGGKDVARRLAACATSHPQTMANWRILDISQPLKAALKLAKLTYPAISRGEIRINNLVGPGNLVRGVSGELIEVFQNLISNAVDAMNQGGELKVRSQIEGDYLELLFIDSGHGMNRQLKAKVFAPFFSTKGSQGHGLGLTASKGIIKAHGGYISLNSWPGAGTTVIIRLPLAHEKTESKPIPQRPVQPQGGHIMLVEDEALIALGIRVLLQNEGYSLSHVSRVAEVQGVLEDAEVDLVLCDFSLPDGNGWQVAKLLTRHEKGKWGQTPIIIMTGWAEPETMAQFPKGVTPPAAILYKPLDKETLLGEIAKALQAARA